jgi:signal transduction histidine kinase
MAGYCKTVDNMKSIKIFLIIIVLLVIWQAGLQANSTELKLKIAEAMGREKVDLLLELAKLEMTEDLESSWASDSLALKLAKESRYQEGESKALTIAGRIKLVKQDYWSAIEYFEKSAELMNGEEDNLARGVISNNIAQAYSKLGWADKAKIKLAEAEQIFLKLDQSDEVVHELTLGYLTWGTIDLELGNYEVALSHFLRGMQEVEKLEMPELEATIKGNIGRVYQSLMNPALSLEYYRQSLEVHQELNNVSEMAVVYGNMGTLYSELEDYAKALEYYEQSMDSYQLSGNNLGVASVLINIGNLYYYQEDFPKTLGYYEQAAEIVGEIGATVYQAYLMNNVGMIYVEMGEYSAAADKFDQANEIAIAVESLELEAEISASYGELYKKQGIFDQALAYNEKESDLRDSIFAETTASQIAEMQTKYNTERKERENVLLRKDNEIKELEIARKELQRNSLFAISALVILLVIFVYRRYRSKKKSAEVLSTKNELITQQKEELSETLDVLRKTQKKLVESEKMASLGSLVTGVAHEINTPVGIIITAITNLSDRLGTLLEKYKTNKMKKSDLDSFLGYTEKTSNLILSNSQRTGELVKSFKKVSVDQSTEARRQFKIHNYIKDVLMSLEPKFTGLDLEIVIDCDEYLVWNSYPGIIAQIITNLVINSVVHGFAGRQSGKVEFIVKRVDNMLNFTYRDSGKGMGEEVIQHIFDPFYTTNKRTGTGLGMHIIYNLITQKLDGSIEVNSEVGEGAEFRMEFPFIEGGLSELK